jgi:hypothetical protein
MLASVVLAGAPTLGQCGSTELSKMNRLTAAFQNDVTILDSLSRDQLEAFRAMAHACTLSVKAKARRAGKQDMHELSKDDLILLYWISAMDDTANSVANLLTAQRCHKSDTLDEQAKCATQARKDFEDWSYSAREGADFVSHYNPSLDRCFVQFQYTRGATAGGRIWFFRTVFDAFEGKEYASYSWLSEKDKKFWEVPPKTCEVTLPSGDKKRCQSDDEFMQIVKVYMGH